jgi:diguanylate cyclase (GGDEF)-like protein
MALVSPLPGLEVPFAWRIVGGVLPLAISIPVTFLLARRSKDVRRLNAKLMLTYEAVKHAAETDHPTGTANRAALDARVAAIHRSAAGWFLMVDIDDFKEVTVRKGHAVGDLALMAVGQTLCKMIGLGDVVGRNGGEEFARFLPNADANTAVATAEGSQKAVAVLSIRVTDGKALALTVSIGIKSGWGSSIADRLSRADQAMYRAKRSGRDQLQIAA